MTSKSAVSSSGQPRRTERQAAPACSRRGAALDGAVFADAAITDPGLKAAIQERRHAIAIAPDSIARAIGFAIEQPDDVEIGSIVVRPTAQD
ncbi:hypothetical protein [Aurantimonas sp. HBX-1]|uniref:hypothetical protein n=1 Tax=Aurantimonas sp. HBX-1 TaxID=2906072 RepID=UPI001F21E794|nr:hypothetical protein [Aurantimonas sp. HBX-1]UIJ70952.1 hypothetical protein LXB15_14615 [Aurantimonas sp. HBX-1]